MVTNRLAEYRKALTCADSDRRNPDAERGLKGIKLNLHHIAFAGVLAHQFDQPVRVPADR